MLESVGMGELSALEQRPPHMWKPGQSGNPTGRPKGPRAQIEAIAAKRGGIEAIWQVLFDLALSPTTNAHVKLRAAQDILDRIHGKAVAAVALDVTSGGAPVGGQQRPTSTLSMAQLQAMKAIATGERPAPGIIDVAPSVHDVIVNAATAEQEQDAGR